MAAHEARRCGEKPGAVTKLGTVRDAFVCVPGTGWVRTRHGSDVGAHPAFRSRSEEALGVADRHLDVLVCDVLEERDEIDVLLLVPPRPIRACCPTIARTG